MLEAFILAWSLTSGTIGEDGQPDNAQPDDGQWTMEGDLNLAGQFGFFTTRIAGDDLNLKGGLTVSSGRVQITADTFFRDGSSVNLASPTSQLRMTGYSAIDPAVSFSGDGTLINADTGVMVMNSGVSLNDLALVNLGELYLSYAGGVASVDRFTSEESATLNIAVVGYESGVVSDLLLVTSGAAILAGELSVAAFAVGPAGLLPQIGDEFVILAASGGVSGAFSNDPVSHVGSLTYDWSIIYNPNTVVVRLENVVPAPGSLALLGAAGAIAVQRRRQRPVQR